MQTVTYVQGGRTVYLAAGKIMLKGDFQ